MKTILLTICILISSFFSFAQKDINTSTLVFGGIDFSQCKVVGPGFNDLARIKHHFMRSAFVDIVIMENHKFRIKKKFKAEEYSIDTSIVNSNNRNININELAATKSIQFNKDKIQEIVNSYGEINHSGVVLVFIVETLNKLDDVNITWITLIDPKTKQVIATERYKGSPGGFGFRNFWANSFKSIINKGPGFLRKAKRGKL